MIIARNKMKLPFAQYLAALTVLRFLVALFLATASPAFADGESLVDGSKRLVSPHMAVFRGLSMSTPIKTSVDVNARVDMMRPSVSMQMICDRACIDAR